MTSPANDPLDEALRAAHRSGMVVVYRGDWPAVEIDVVKLRDVEDPCGDACRRAFNEAERTA